MARKYLRLVSRNVLMRGLLYNSYVKEKVTTKNAPSAVGLLSQAIVSNGFIFVAGQIHSAPDGKILEGTTEEKTHQIMRNLEAILKAAGADLNNVVKATIYVTDIAELPKVNNVYKTYFAEPMPAREGVCVTTLPLGATVEISVIAVKE